MISLMPSSSMVEGHSSLPRRGTAVAEVHVRTSIRRPAPRTCPLAVGRVQSRRFCSRVARIEPRLAAQRAALRRPTVQNEAQRTMLKQLLAKKSMRDLDAAAQCGELRRALGPWTLTALGIGGIIGTGIFVLTGIAATNNAGPALALSFILAGAICGLAALCYAEFAALIPVAGSAYSYAYTTMGELMAWFIGWNLVLEYLVSISAVSVGWSGYCVQLLTNLGDKLGVNLTIPAEFANSPLVKGATAWDVTMTGAIINLPAVVIVAIITGLCYYGIRQSTFVNSLIVAIKVIV